MWLDIGDYARIGVNLSAGMSGKFWINLGSASRAYVTRSRRSPASQLRQVSYYFADHPIKEAGRSPALRGRRATG